MPAETEFLQCLQRVAAWCRLLGIQTLTVFDSRGVIYGCSDDVYRLVFPENETSEDGSEPEVECPLTPPPSDSSGSRTPSPEHATFPADLNALHLSGLRKRRNVGVRRQPSKGVSSASSKLTLYIASSASGKPAIASASRSLLQRCVGGASMLDGSMPSKFPYKLKISELGKVLESGLPPPDFIIIHDIHGMKMPYLHPPIEFHGFPPWQINIAEFHRTDPDDGHERDPTRSESPGTPQLISETAFRRALDEYSRAEFRLGR
ncbi:hypothetical protein OG21DRAFT_1516939 [Imleria badia]|nr:hypothetical protein OG21DRAFT_1516939 [Imleria badia]